VTTSTFAWLDYSDGERRRMFEVIELFREKGTLDELGIGSIRDTFADHFFPGVSTIQTRARYFLFVPWLYQLLERDRITSARAWPHARWLQAKLVESLKRGGEGPSRGLIGIDAGANLQRPPNIIYWAGLRRFGVMLFPGSIDRYHGSLDAFYHSERRAVRSEGEELLEGARHNWNPNLPPPPDGFPDGDLSFRLRHEDADFLAEQIRHHAGESLLARCLSPAIRRLKTARAVWDLGGLETLPNDLQVDIEHARRFALVMEGAVRTYNLALAEAAEERGLISSGALTAVVRKDLAAWSDEMRANGDQIRAWDRPTFWARLYDLNRHIPPGSQRFVDSWLQAAVASPDTVIDDPAIRVLIARRERQLKGSLARLHNERALERWSGASGIGRMSYRWNPEGRQIVTDILDGLGRPPEDD
jgi:hypothetical protein